MRLDIDARFIPFSIIIWTISIFVISYKVILLILSFSLILLLLKFKKINYIHLLVAITALLSSYSRIVNAEVPNLTPGIPVVMELKVISDVNKNKSHNIGIYRPGESFYVIGKTYQIAERGIHDAKIYKFKSRIKVDFEVIGQDIEFGSKIVVNGFLKEYNFQNIKYSIKVDNYYLSKNANILDKFINEIRTNFLDMTSTLPGDAKELLPGLILGDTRNQSQSLSQDMKNSGLTHLTAVSGGNIAILLLATLWLSQKLKLKIKSQIFIGLITLVFFALLVRSEPSVVRASFMGAISILGIFSGTRRHGISALALTVCVVLLIDPNLATSWGFCLSVFATAGLLIFTKPISNALTKHFPNIPESLSLLIAVALSAQIATSGLVAGFSGQLTLWSIPANLLAAPAIPVVTIVGYLTLLFSNIFLPLAFVLGQVAALFANWVGFVAQMFSSRALSVIQVPNGLRGFLLVSMGLILFFGIISLNLKSYFFSPWLLIFIISAFSVFVFFNKSNNIGNWPQSKWQFVMCDVGQGDGLVLKDSTGKVLVVDVGPNGNLMHECLKSLKIKKIDALILSHFHADHVEGLEIVKKRHKILKTYVTWVEDPELEVERVREILKDIPPEKMLAGDVITLGKMKIQCLWPTKTKILLGSIPNNSSIVNLITIGNASFLLTGDIEPPAQEMIRKNWQIPPVDVMKVPHHGSKFQDTNFPSWTNARLALISVGKENRYGHPSKTAQDLYRNSGMQLLSTDEVGSIAIEIGADDSIRVKTKD
ncbi:MAG: hypothetical protein RIS18_775 [Actinomycetota bacterium]